MLDSQLRSNLSKQLTEYLANPQDARPLQDAVSDVICLPDASVDDPLVQAASQVQLAMYEFSDGVNTKDEYLAELGDALRQVISIRDDAVVRAEPLEV